MIRMSQAIVRQHATGRIARKLGCGVCLSTCFQICQWKSQNGEVRKLQDSFFKTRDQIERIIRLVRLADQPSRALDVLDGLSLNPGRPTILTGKIEEAIKTINKDKLMK